MTLRDRLNRLESRLGPPKGAVVVVYDPATGLPPPRGGQVGQEADTPLDNPLTVIWLPDNGRDPALPE